MVKIALQLRLRLENLTNVHPEGEDFRWYVKLKCNACGEDTPDLVYLDLLMSDELKGGRGHATIVLKCKLCSRQNSIDIMREHFGHGGSGDQNAYGKYTLEDSESQRYKDMVVFDCRGVEPVDFSPRGGWSAGGAETTTTFSDIDLTEGEWADYDEKASEAVGIYDIEHRFVKA